MLGAGANGFSLRHLVEEGSWDWFRASPVSCATKDAQSHWGTTQKGQLCFHFRVKNRG